MNEKTLHKVSYGLYIVCSKDNNKINGQIINVLFQVTSDPPTIAICINKKNLTHEYIDKSKAFSASILSENASMSFIGNFGFKSGRNIDKFKDIKYDMGKLGVPIVLDYSIGYIECKVINKFDVGTHTLFIGKIEDAEILKDEHQMTYEYYHICKGGVSPKTAPTYSNKLDKIKQKEVKKMDRYVCNICGYVYDPEKGDPDNGIKPGTKFEDLPDDWICPLCGASKEDFSKE